MDVHAIAAGHAEYLEKQIRGSYLGHRSPETQDGAVEWTGNYCRDRLPNILIDRNDPLVHRDDDFDGRDQ